MTWLRGLSLAMALLVVSGCGGLASPRTPPAQRSAVSPDGAVTALPSPVSGRGGQRTEDQYKADDRSVGDHEVWTWGRAGGGIPLRQREAGDFERVGVLARIVAVEAGLEQRLALDADGVVWTWFESTAPKPVPAGRQERAVEGLCRVSAIASGDTHNLALCTDGTVRAWGGNLHGQLGDGTRETRSNPEPVLGLQDAIAISAGSNHSLAILADGTVRAWGLGTLGRLGTGNNEGSSVPIPVPGIENITAVAAGGRHSLAVGADGTVWTWGYALLGDQTETGTFHTQPVAIPALGGGIAVAAGWTHSLALTAGGQVWAWGYNSFGELGDDEVTLLLVDGGEWIELVRGEPRPVPGLGEVTAIAAGEHHSLALRRDGTLWAWGSNAFGELGSSRTRDPIYRTLSEPVPTLYGVSAIAAHGVHSLAVLNLAGRALPSPQFTN